MSPVSSSVELSSAGDVQMMKPLDTPSPTELHTAVDVATLDPAVMQEKIKQLTSRISEVCWYVAIIFVVVMLLSNAYLTYHNLSSVTT